MSDGRNTSASLAGSRTAYQESSNASATSNAPHSSAANASVSDYGNRNTAIIALILAAFALGGMLWAVDDAKEAKREASIATMRVEGMTRALIKYGITDTYPHLPSEDD
jgi:hypothetical protein